MGLCFLIIFYFFVFKRETFKPIALITDDFLVREHPFIESFSFYIVLYVTNIVMCLAYSGGYPFKEPFYKNSALCICVFLNIFLMMSLFFVNIYEELKIGGVIRWLFVIPHLEKDYQLKTFAYLVIYIVS